MKVAFKKFLAIVIAAPVLTASTSVNVFAADDNHVHSFTGKTVYSYSVVNPARHTVIVSTMYTCECGVTYTEYESSHQEAHNFGVGKRTGNQYHHASQGLHYYECEASCLQCGFTHTYWTSVPCDGSNDDLDCPILFGLDV